MSDDPAEHTTSGVTYGKRAAHLPAPPPGPRWPFETCVRFCAIPHELGDPCRSFGDQVFLSLRSVDPDTGEPRFVMIFPDSPDGTEVALSAHQAAVLATELSPESLR